MSRFVHRLAVTAIGAVVAGITPAAAQGADSGWTKVLATDLSRHELDLPARAPAARLARAALDRSAARLGLSRSSGLRLVSRFRPPRSAGGRELRVLRFGQTASGLRVVWSQLDVTIAGGEVSSISATVVPVAGPVRPGERRVTRGRALRIARRAVPRAEAVLRPLPAAYAGSPGKGRSERWRRARRVWVVELEPPATPGDDAPTGLCIVVDARSGRVIARWPGIADRPDRGPDARGATAPAPGVAAVAAAAVDPRTRESQPLVIWDATGKESPPPLGEDFYAEFRTTGNTRLRSSWPPYLEARDPFADPSADMDALTANAASAAREVCVVRGWCGREGAWQPGALSVSPWIVMGNTTGGSHMSPGTLYVWIGHDSIAPGTGARAGRPDLAFNDSIAHEFGHVMDLVYAGDRFPGNQFSFEGKEVQEALADMFAYDFDREDATIGEETGGAYRDWEVPGRLSFAGQPYPAHMRDYDTTPPLDARGNPIPHLNSTILSHAYYEFVKRIGHHQAGRVLHNVPATLSPFPIFKEVARGFVGRAGEIYPQDGSDAGTRSDAREAAEQAFSQVGIHIRDHRGEQPG